MAKSRTSYKPGQTGNKDGLGGRPPLSPEVKAIRQITRDDLVEIGLMVVRGDVTALEELLSRMKDKDPTRRPTAMQALAASCMMHAIKKGEVHVLNSLLDRFFGKMPIAVLVANLENPTGREAKAITFEVQSGTPD